MCGNISWVLCFRLERNIIAPNVKLDGYNLREEVLRWIDLRMPNSADPSHFLSPIEDREAIDNNNFSLEKLLTYLHASKNYSK